MRKKYILSMIKIFFIMMLGVSGTGTVFAEVINVGPHNSTHSGSARGFWFTAPSDFVITGLSVPTDASVSDFNVAVLRHNPGTPWPLWATTTNDFTVLHYSTNNPGAGFISVNIPVTAGQVIGILGTRGVGDHNSYGTSPSFASTIGGLPVTLTRFGMQHPLSTTAPADVWQEPGAYNISRVLVRISASSHAIPTLQEWALILLVILLLVASIKLSRKRQQI